MILYRESLILIMHAACMISARLISGASHSISCISSVRAMLDAARDEISDI